MTIKDYEMIYQLCEEHYDKTTLDHAKRVENYVLSDCRYYFYNKEDKWFIRALCLAHDLIEDTDITIDYLKTLNLPIDFINELIILTHDKNKMSYEEYVKWIANYGGRPLLVKCGDMKDHLKEFHTLTPSLKNRYSKVLKYLK